MSYFFKKPFAQNGDVTEIPLEDQGDGNVSYAEGWPEGYELDPAKNPEDARNLSRTNFNGLFFNITQALQQLQIYGVNPYISAADNGGTPYPYPEGGCCYYTDPATNEVGVYRSLQSNNTEVPSVNGVTSDLWRREFDVQLDTLKSNRISNCPLYYPTEPLMETDDETDTVTITIYAGTKVLLAQGYDDDFTLKSRIMQLVNTESISYTFTGEMVNKYFFLTEDNTFVLMDSKNYIPLTNLEAVVSFLGGVGTDYDVYYFDVALNKWQYREANSDEFVDAPKQMVLIGNFVGDSVDNVTFQYNSPLVLTSKEYFDNTVANLQPIITPSRYVTFTPTPMGGDIMDIDLPSTATPFSVNSGNLNESGNPDLCTSQAITLPSKLQDVLFSNSGTITSNVTGNSYTKVQSYAGLSMTEEIYLRQQGIIPTRTVATQIMTASNVQNIFGPNSGTCSATWKVTNGTNTSFTIATITLSTPITLSTTGCTLECDVYSAYRNDRQKIGIVVPVGKVQWAQASASADFYFNLYFDDNTSISYAPSATSNQWKHSSYDLSSFATAGKKITKIAVVAKAYVYDSKSILSGSITAYIKGIRILNTVTQVQYVTNSAEFKVGSNYYKKLSEDGDAMLSSELGDIASSSNYYDNLWFNSLADIPAYADSLSSVYEFKETPAETNNAKLVLRYIDQEDNQVFGGLAIKLVYWGDVEYTVCENLVLNKSQDLLFSIPDGKYIKKVAIFASQMKYLRNVQVGMLQIYNNVPSETVAELAQYPALHATAADTDRTKITLMTLDDLQLTSSGYLMMSRAGAYILPGTNVIRKQKKQPTISDDPALTDGDVWLDYSKEPIMAYQYKNSRWEIFSDVPIGYVTLSWSNPSASATVAGTGITAASVTASTFATQVPGSGEYVFTYDGTNWQLEGNNVTLNTYGISTTGTAAEGDIITVTFTESVPSVSNLEVYPYNQNGYNVNAFTSISGALVGKDGRDGQPGKDGKNGAPGAKGDPGIGIPSGGLTGMVLAKASNESYNCKWTTMASTALFDGGEAGMTLVKNSSQDLDFSWASMPSGIPDGGQTGECLIKASDSNQDVTWGTVQSLPAGGQTGYVLAKSSPEDFSVTWTNPAGLLSIYDNDTSFMLSAYFYAQANAYSAVTVENFHSNSGINGSADDGAAVLSTYYSSIDLNVLNSSANSISFRLNEITSTNAISSLIAHWEGTGTITVSISLDSGTSWSTLTDYSPFAMNYATGFIIKVTLAAGASIKNLAFITK